MVSQKSALLCFVSLLFPPAGCGCQVQELGRPARQAARLDRPALLHHGACVGLKAGWGSANGGVEAAPRAGGWLDPGPAAFNVACLLLLEFLLLPAAASS